MKKLLVLLFCIITNLTILSGDSSDQKPQPNSSGQSINNSAQTRTTSNNRPVWQDYRKKDFERYQTYINQIISSKDPDNVKQQLIQEPLKLQAQILEQRTLLAERQN